MDTFARDLRYAVRALLRMRGVAVVAILTLALGIGATTTMFSVVYARLLRPPPFADAGQLAILFNTSVTPTDGLTRWRWSMPNITALRSSATSFETVASFTGALLSMSGRGDPELVEGEVVSSDYFRTLRVSPIAGRTFDAAEDTVGGAQPVTMIGWRLWRRTFAGDPAIIGGTIVVNDVPLTIVGILPEGFTGLTGKADLWVPPPMAARLTYADYLTTPQNFISVVARLKEGATLTGANAELAAIGPRFVGEGRAPGTVWGAIGVPLRDARVEPSQRQSALMLLAAAVCVLVIACANVASLLLARGRVRRREIAVRLAIGSGRRRLVQQMLTEGLVMAAAAGVCGTVLAWWGVDVFARTAPAVIPSGRNNYLAIGSLGAPALDPAVLMFALATAVGTTLLCALAPALAASKLELVTALKEDNRSGGRRGRALSILVVSEVAIACLLLTASGLLIENFARIQSRRSGFVADDVLTFWVRPPGSRYPIASGPATVDRLLTRIQAVPGVESAAVNRCTPFSGCSRTILFLPGRPIDPSAAPRVGRHYISADYFQTLRIPILAGRGIAPTDRAGAPPVAVVNESGARRFWPGENPIGKRVWFGTTTGPFSDPARAVEIVGVAGDVKYRGCGSAGPARPGGLLHVVSAILLSGHDDHRQGARRRDGAPACDADSSRVGGPVAAHLRRDDPRRADRRRRLAAEVQRHAPRLVCRRGDPAGGHRRVWDALVFRLGADARYRRPPRARRGCGTGAEAGDWAGASARGSRRRDRPRRLLRPRAARRAPAARRAGVGRPPRRHRRHHHARRVGGCRLHPGAARQRGRSDGRAQERVIQNRVRL